MLSLHNEMSRLFFVLDAPFSDDKTISIQFISPGIGDGASCIAREFAMVAAQQIKGNVLLLDLNLDGSSQCADISDDKTARVQTLKKVTSDHIALDLLWQPTSLSNTQEEQPSPKVELYQSGQTNLYVTTNIIPEGFEVSASQLKNENDFWASLHKHYQLVIVDSPALTENYDGLVCARHVDSTIMVLSAEKTRRPVATNLRDRILESGGHIAGVVFNRREMHIPPLMYKFL